MTECIQIKGKRVLTLTGTLALLTLLVLAPLQPAWSYVDPNSVGPLYQFLFPALIAIASAFAALRRQLVRLWNRVVGTVVAAVRGERQPPHTH